VSTKQATYKDRRDRLAGHRFEALDQAMSKTAIKRLNEVPAANQESQESFPWHPLEFHLIIVPN